VITAVSLLRLEELEECLCSDGSKWRALLENTDPKTILNNKRLLEARQEINAEVERQTHAAPKFSKDGKIAVLRINSKAQVHPVIATRWVRLLRQPDLTEITLTSVTGRPSQIKST
jgi:hypothetical protein